MLISGSVFPPANLISEPVGAYVCYIFYELLRHRENLAPLVTTFIATLASGFTFAGIATSTPQLKAGRIKALAIGGPSRTPLFPDVPTFTELGYPEVETHAWFGLFVPAGSPREAVTRIHRDTRKILDEPEFRQKQLVDKGYEVVGSGPEEFAAYIAKDSESRARAVKISGAKAE
jgi:tripartite-type tricarboxylate transporter receptor subunit TctC